MKKILIAIAAAMTMGTAVMAQENNEQPAKQQRQKPSQAEMVKRHTDQMVERYQLNDEQAAQLLDLNTRYAEKMGPMMGGPRGPRGERPDRQANRLPQRDRKEAKAASPDSAQREPMPQEAQRPADRREEMRQVMQEYEAELQQIMTEEQFQAYKKDQEQRGKPGNRRAGRGDRRGDKGDRQQKQ